MVFSGVFEPVIGRFLSNREVKEGLAQFYSGAATSIQAMNIEAVYSFDCIE